MRAKIFNGLVMPLVCIALLAISSCHNQFYRGYGYKGSTGAPDVNPEMKSVPVSESSTLGAAAQHARESSQMPKTSIASEDGSLNSNTPVASQPSFSRVHSEEIASAGVEHVAGTRAVNPEIQSIALDEAGKLAEEGKEVNHENLARNLGRRLSNEGKIKALTPAEERKMTRLAAKMDKKIKKQGKEIDWKNNSGLELFFMIMAIGGLVLGIVGVGIGWFVFIVFAGLWLYFKLARD